MLLVLAACCCAAWGLSASGHMRFGLFPTAVCSSTTRPASACAKSTLAPRPSLARRRECGSARHLLRQIADIVVGQGLKEAHADRLAIIVFLQNADDHTLHFDWLGPRSTT